MFFSRALCDITATVLGCLFLLQSGLTGQWQWLRKPWVLAATALCALSLISSVHMQNMGAIAQAACLPRLFLITAATENWVLTRNNRRLLLSGVFLLLAVWLISQCWEQYFTGTNLIGAPAWLDGSLTGPFIKPRAGFTFLMLFFPGIMPVVLYALKRRSGVAKLAGVALLLLSVLTMVFIGQRMSTVLMMFGLFLTALMVRQFRWPFVGVILGMMAALISLPLLSPPTYAKLVIKFSDQLQHFSTSDYGQLFKKATIMVLNHPVLGLGMDGFRNFCHLSLQSNVPALVGLPQLESPAPLGCNIHPHNYYLQIATTAGLPGLFAFCALIFFWLRAGWQRLNPIQHSKQAMLLVMCCTVLWPITSTSAFFTFPTAGWIFLFAGWLLAESKANADAPATVNACSISEKQT
ncbi:O-antigen ligase family protein [Acetobacter cibinongensis]|uniref:O-antigen ligase family protein n=1 Tax=Acetobacter cibinongensis TaxID=146475 RepID=UPI001F0A23E0|nr:O-antigen ligase family protein [Acetobacter cibinongensis]